MERFVGQQTRDDPLDAPSHTPQPAPPDKATGILTALQHTADEAFAATLRPIRALILEGKYAAAADALAHIETAQRQGHLWSATIQTLIQTCQAFAAQLQRQADPVPAQAPQLTPQTLQVNNLGVFHIRRAGTTLPPCHRRKVIDLFRYLLTRTHHHASKDEIIDVLWPDAEPAVATHRLHVAITTLRRYLDAPADTVMIHEAGQYRISESADLIDDSAVFEQLCCRGNQHWKNGDTAQAQRIYAQALGYYHGDYYVDSDCATWALIERERLIVHYLTILDHLGHLRMQEQRFLDAVECYQRVLERDMYREDIHVRVMQCYWHLGRRADAIRQYQRCVEVLKGDLGLEPLDETQKFYQHVLQA